MPFRRINRCAPLVFLSTLVSLTVVSGLTTITKAIAKPEKEAKETKSAEPAEPAAAGKEKLPLVMDFFATWCGPCKVFKPTYEAAEKEFSGRIEMKSLDVDKPENKKLALKYKIKSVPTVIFLDAKGNEVNRTVGAMSKEGLETELKGLLSKN